VQELLNIEQFCQRKFNKIRTKKLGELEQALDSLLLEMPLVNEI
jgi:hypothetical protein